MPPENFRSALVITATRIATKISKLQAFTSQECANYLKNAGYASS